MASTNLKRQWWHAYRCTPGIVSPYGFFGRHPVRAANEQVVEAWYALEQAHLGMGYVPTKGAPTGTRRNCPAGILGRPCKPNGQDCSLHNYCIAIDVEYSLNRKGPHYPKNHTRQDVFTRDRHLHTYTLEQILRIEGVLTLTGTPLFRWLGWIGDYMHWEIDVPPEEVSVDWRTVPSGTPPAPPDGGGGGKTMTDQKLPLLRHGDGLKSKTYGDRTHLRVEVAMLQAALRAKGFVEAGTSHDQVCGVDGSFWDGTLQVVKSFQASKGLVVDGVVGSKTWQALMS